MNIELMLVALVPLVLFVCIEVFYGLKAGIWAAMITAVLGFAYFYFKIGEVDSMLASEIVLIVLLGLVSLKTLNGRFFKMQPVLLAIVFSLYTAYSQLFDQPVLVKMIGLFKAIDPKMATMYSSSAAQAFLSTVSAHIIILFLLHGLLVYWGATKLKSFGWLMTRLAFYPMFFVFMIIEFILNKELVQSIS